MFEIDLLKGNGRPRKTSVKCAVIRTIVLLIPLGAAMVYAIEMQNDRTELAAIRQSIAANEAGVNEYADDMRYLADLRAQLDGVALSISEIGQALRYRIVTSPVLVEIAESLPAEIYVREMNWKRTPQRDRIVDSKTGQVRFETCIQRSLKLSLCGREGADGDAAVQAYIAHLEKAPALKPVLREIRPASRQQIEIKGENTTVYEVELFLKEQR
jgi:hypothetical protein